jgi:hypothetical protein
MTATDADRIRAAELWGRDWPAGIFDIAAALAEARGEHGPRHCVSVDDANRVLSEERAAHERTAAALAAARAEADELRADVLALAEELLKPVDYEVTHYRDGLRDAARRLRALAGDQP